MNRSEHDVDTCQIGDCGDCEQAICQRCGQYKTNQPSLMIGDDLCGPCREKTDREDQGNGG